MKSTKILAAAAALLLATSAGCAKQSTSSSTDGGDYPGGKNIQLIVPFAAGGTTDVMARALAPELEKELGSKIQVVNREGAGGQIGLTALAQAKPDGYTIGFTNLPSTVASYLGKDRNATYDRSSFVPISGISETENYMAVRTGNALTTFQQVIDAAKAKPKTLSVAYAGDDERLAVVGIEQATGASFNLVPFDGGADKTAALLGGKVDLIIGGGPTVLPQVQAKKFTPIVVVGPNQDTFVPDVPTLASLDIPVDLGGTIMISGPKGTPENVVTTLSTAIEKVVDSDSFKTAAKNNWQAAAYLDPAQSAEAWVKAEEDFKKLLAADGS